MGWSKDSDRIKDDLIMCLMPGILVVQYKMNTFNFTVLKNIPWKEMRDHKYVLDIDLQFFAAPRELSVILFSDFCGVL